WGGELDAADVAELTDAWQSLLADHPVSVVIDLAAVTFLDCAVLSVLVRANRAPGTHLFLRAVPPRVRQLLHRTGLSDSFTVVSTADPLDLTGYP
ncbi:MAG: STAS domain-containing protein, partial [Janthinobacterium lividum]